MIIKRNLYRGISTEVSMAINKKKQIYDENYWNQYYASKLGVDAPLPQVLPVIIFTALVVMIVRMHTYTREMDQFYWSAGSGTNADFFSYYKMVAILVCAILAVLIMLYKFTTQSVYIRKCPYYIPMCIYSLFVIISYIFCDYKDFSLLGYNDRFEGTLTVLAYMVMLFFTINIVNGEKNVKWIINTLAVSSALLCLLGLTQALDHDFFRTTIGKKLITPSSFWEHVDSLNFTFQNKEIYQTVYNINYVSFYLTLLIPLFGMIFVRTVMKGKEEPAWKKLMWGLLFALLIYNMIGAASSGGFLGMSFVLLTAVILLNKRILSWWKPVAILVVITIIVFGITAERWMPELSGTFNSVTDTSASSEAAAGETGDASESTAEKAGSSIPYIDYFVTEGTTISASFNGNPITFDLVLDESSSGNVQAINLKDADGQALSLKSTSVDGYFAIDDDRFYDYCTVAYTLDDNNVFYVVLTTAGTTWPFGVIDGTVYYMNGVGNPVLLNKVDSIGFANNLEFGSGRGYIWSRTIPMMAKTFIIGYGTDTYCLEFPQNDYAGKYNCDTFRNNVSIIVDKPHNLYMHMWTGSGGIATLAFLAIAIMYFMQGIKTYRKRDYFSMSNYNSDFSFLSFAGVGIFLGICGFLVSSLVDDSTVSVMPMFYGLLGTGTVINMILLKQTKASK